ncbi:glycosyltransferase family 4 protein [Lutibacter sp. TH_r2]|uniref:glycosyltransferase family 4 protein n=1 Tax=Lutibacter sp. TH_r2 TaxID=3082083 RepID=UPI003985E6F1
MANYHNVTLIHLVTDLNINCIEVDNKIINNVKTKIIYIPRSFSKAFTFFKIYFQQINSIKGIDIIHLNITYPVGSIAYFLKKIKNKPYIISEHSTIYQKENSNKISVLQKFITKQIIKNASFVCPVSDNLSKSMLALGLKGNYYSIPNVVNTNQFVVSNKTPKLFTVTHISHLGNNHKNITGILDVLYNLQKNNYNFIFNLIGENSIKYKSYSEKLGLKNVNFINHISACEVVKYLQNSSVFVLFSNYENLPCVILESFSCGTPVISTNVGGIAEYFPKDFGYLIQKGNKLELEEKLSKFMDDNKSFQKEEMHNYAIDNFGIAAINTKFSNLYFKTLKLE